MNGSDSSMGITRRRCLAVCGSVAGLSGCTSIQSTLGNQSHPFADSTAIFQIDQVTQDRNRLKRLLTEALSFWNSSKNQQYLDYTTTLRYRADATEPDVLVSEVTDIKRCKISGEQHASGCANLLQGGDQGQLPAKLRVTPQPASADWHYRQVIMHEVGHLLGLTHDDKPADVMHPSWERRYPEYDKRKHILSLRTERANAYNTGVKHAKKATSAVNSKQYQSGISSFKRARSAYRNGMETIKSSRAIMKKLSEFEPANRDKLASLLQTEASYIQSVLTAIESMITGAQSLAAGKQGRSTYNQGIRKYNAANKTELPNKAAYIAAVGFPEEIINANS